MTNQLRDFDSNGVNIRYLLRGTGEPIILLHGFIFSIGPAWVEGGLVDAFSQRNQVVALDLRGHGASGKPHDAARYGVEMVRDVLRLIEHLNLDAVHIVGYSLGGILALKLLELAPKRVRSLALGGAAWVREGDSTYQSWLPLAEMLERVRPGEALSSYFWPNAAQRPPQQITQIVDANDPSALAAVARGMLNVTVPEKVLRSNRIPTLAIHGEQDPVRTNVEAMKGIMSDLTIQIVPGFDHNSLPGSQAFRDSLLNFIRKHKGRE